MSNDWPTMGLLRAMYPDRNVLYLCAGCRKVYEFDFSAEACMRSHPPETPPTNEDR
jgi:hypothetical protein